MQLVQEEGPEANLYVESLADGSRRRLASIKTMKEGGDVFVTLFMLLPAWSPDGRKIVLGCYDEEDKPFVGVIDAEAGDNHCCTFCLYWGNFSSKMVAYLVAGRMRLEVVCETISRNSLHIPIST